MRQPHDIGSDGPTLPVNDPLAADGNVPLAVRQQQGRKFVLIVVEGVQRAEQHRPFLQFQTDSRLKMNRPRQVPAYFKDQPATAPVMDKIDGILYRTGIQRHAVGADAKHRSRVVFRRGSRWGSCRSSERPKQEEKIFYHIRTVSRW